MGSKIKTFLWTRRTEILTVCVLALTVLAAFQLGRLSVMYGQPSAFEIVETPAP